MMENKNFQILSPDGFPIGYGESYNTKEEAEQAFDIWKQRYEQQGYYSSNKGRIALDDLRNHCNLITIS